MNKTRRNALNALQDRITALQTALAPLRAELESIGEDLEMLRDEEQESYDNLPEGLQNGERGETMSDAIGRMEDAHSTLTQICDAIDIDELSEAFSAIEDAKGQA